MFLCILCNITTSLFGGLRTAEKGSGKIFVSSLPQNMIDSLMLRRKFLCHMMYCVSSDVMSFVVYCKTKMAVLMHRLSTHSRDVNYCSFSSCSKILASVSGDKTVRLWDVEKGTELDFSPLTGHTYQVSTCAFSPFGTILATGSQDCSVLLWNTSTGERLNVLQGHRGGIKCCTFSPNSNYLASASSDETLCIWDNSSKQLLRVLKGHESSVSTCRFSPDNLYILSGSSNGDLMLSEVQSGKCRARAMAHDMGVSGVGVTGCDFSPTFGSAGEEIIFFLCLKSMVPG